MKYIKKFESSDTSSLKGWVNIKVDSQLFIRMAKYVVALDSILAPSLKYNLFSKIDALSKVDSYIDNENVDIQTKISIITLLQYLNEIKTQFNPSSSGFLLEGFLAALIHGKILDDYSATDIKGRNLKADADLSYGDRPAPQYETPTQSSKKIKYQIKLYKKGNNIKVSWNPSDLCDFYVLCLKDGEKIDIHILTSDPNDKETYIRKFEVLHRTQKEEKKYIEINTNKLYTVGNKYKRTLDVDSNTIDYLIQKCGDSVKDSIANIYNKLSDLHYDVDALVTGLDKNKNKIQVDAAKKNADNTISDITNDISKFNNDMISGL